MDMLGMASWSKGGCPQGGCRGVFRVIRSTSIIFQASLGQFRGKKERKVVVGVLVVLYINGLSILASTQFSTPQK
jgi:hypothetical protein